MQINRRVQTSSVLPLKGGNSGNGPHDAQAGGGVSWFTKIALGYLSVFVALTQGTRASLASPGRKMLQTQCYAPPGCPGLIPQMGSTAAAENAALSTLTTQPGTNDPATQAFLDTSNFIAALMTIDEQAPLFADPVPGWLQVQGNALTLNGRPFRGHGVNLYDTTLNGLPCASASYFSGNVNLTYAEELRAIEVIRRGQWAAIEGANYIRLNLDARPIFVPSGSNSNGVYYDQPELSRILTDQDYFNSITSIVSALTSNPGVFVDLTLFSDPSATGQCDRIGISTGGTPTPASLPVWQKLVNAFGANKQVVWGLANEPRNCMDAATLALTALNITLIINGIRQYEQDAGVSQHIIKVPSLQTSPGAYKCCSRDFSYWAAHPLNLPNVVYSGHFYEDFTTLQQEIGPFKQLPIIVDEIAPFLPTTVNASDFFQSIAYLEQSSPPISYVAWIFDNNQLGLRVNGGEDVGSTHTGEDMSLIVTPVMPNDPTDQTNPYLPQNVPAATPGAPPQPGPENNACGIGIPLKPSPLWGFPYLTWLAAVSFEWGIGQPPSGR